MLFVAAETLLAIVVKVLFLEVLLVEMVLLMAEVFLLVEDFLLMQVVFAAAEVLLMARGVAAGGGVFVDRGGVNGFTGISWRRWRMKLEIKLRRRWRWWKKVRRHTFCGGARPVGGSTDFCRINQHRNRGSPSLLYFY
jgi:hypothetical protein